MDMMGKPHTATKHSSKNHRRDHDREQHSRQPIPLPKFIN
jgi:hypothetical protein